MSNKFFITEETILKTEKGGVRHIIKKTSNGYDCFGEAYLSSIKAKSIKGWKKHNKMTLNLMVLTGQIRFVIFEKEQSLFHEFLIDSSENKRLTIKPGLWVAFEAIKSDALLINIANMTHDPEEQEIKNLNELNFNWSKI
jgi:dTDP-4-dehydrorhamnose 3,5-epimerase